MPKPEENMYKLYNNLRSSGRYALPEYSDFKEDMSNDESRRSIYDMIIEGDEFNVPDYDKFSSDMGYGKSEAELAAAAREKEIAELDSIEAEQAKWWEEAKAAQEWEAAQRKDGQSAATQPTEGQGQQVQTQQTQEVEKPQASVQDVVVEFKPQQTFTEEEIKEQDKRQDKSSGSFAEDEVEGQSRKKEKKEVKEETPMERSARIAREAAEGAGVDIDKVSSDKGAQGKAREEIERATSGLSEKDLGLGEHVERTDAVSDLSAGGHNLREEERLRKSIELANESNPESKPFGVNGAEGIVEALDSVRMSPMERKAMKDVEDSLSRLGDDILKTEGIVDDIYNATENYGKERMSEHARGGNAFVPAHIQMMNVARMSNEEKEELLSSLITNFVDGLSAMMSKPQYRSAIDAEAERLGVDRDTFRFYAQKYVLDKMQSDLEEKFIREGMPKSDAEWILYHLKSSISGNIASGATMTKTQRDWEKAGMQLYEEENSPGFAAKVAGVATEFAADLPIFMAASATGSAAIGLATRAELALLTSRGVSEMAARKTLEAALRSNKLLGMAHSAGQRALGSGMTLGTYSAASSAADQLADKNFSLSETAGAFGKGFVTGAILGGTSGVMSSATANATGLNKVMAGVANVAAETGAFMGAEQLQRNMAGEELLSWDDALVDAFATVVAMRVGNPAAWRSGVNFLRDPKGALSSKYKGVEFTPAEIEQMKERFSSRSFVGALLNMEQSGGRNAVRGERAGTKLTDPAREEELQRNWENFMNDPEIDFVTKQKVATIVGAPLKVAVPEPARMDSRWDEESGRGEIIVRDVEGRRIMTLSFDSEKAFESKVNEINAAMVEDNAGRVLDPISWQETARDMRQAGMTDKELAATNQRLSRLFNAKAWLDASREAYNEAVRNGDEETQRAIGDAISALQDEVAEATAALTAADRAVLNCWAEYTMAKDNTVRERTEAAERLIAGRTNVDTGEVVEATLKGEEGKKVYIVSGRVTSREDGSIVEDASDDTIVVRDEEGNTQMISPKDLSRIGSVTDPADDIAAAADEASEDIDRERIEGQQEEDFVPGAKVVFTDDGGNEHRATISDVVDDGYIITADEMPDRPTPIRREDAAERLRLADGEQSQEDTPTEEGEGRRRKLALRVGDKDFDAEVIETLDNGDIFIYTDDAVILPDVEGESDSPTHTHTLKPEELERLTVERKAPTTEEPEGKVSEEGIGVAMQKIPKDLGGEPLYEEASAEDTYAALAEQSGGDAVTARTTIDAIVLSKEGELEQAQEGLREAQKALQPEEIGKVVLDKSPDEIVQAVKAARDRVKDAQSAVDDAQASVDYWNSVKAVADERGKQRQETAEEAPEGSGEITTVEQALDFFKHIKGKRIESKDGNIYEYLIEGEEGKEVIVIRHYTPEGEKRYDFRVGTNKDAEQARRDIIAQAENARECLESGYYKLQEAAQKTQSRAGTSDEERFQRRIDRALEAAEKGDWIGVANELRRIRQNMRYGGVSTDEQRTIIERLEQQLKDNGYELNDLYLTPYNEGMTVIGTFIPDGNYPEEVEIIIGANKPQVSKDGKLVQAAEVRIRMGEASSEEDNNRLKAELKERANKAREKQSRGEALSREEEFDIAAQKQVESKERSKQLEAEARAKLKESNEEQKKKVEKEEEEKKEQEKPETPADEEKPAENVKNEGENAGDSVKAEEEAKPTEQDLLRGVPEVEDDRAIDARERGYRNQAGHLVARQEPIEAIKGDDVSIAFSQQNVPEGSVAIIDVRDLQPSHRQGQRNVYHFLDEAQPKDRKDIVSSSTARDIAKNIRPAEITATATAYTGAPVVNARGEAIQGNNRADALRVMWESFPESAERYKEYLKEHASEFGLTAEDIDRVERPVLVKMLDVDDAEAIKLGQFKASDLESGGRVSIDARKVSNLFNDRSLSAFIATLFDARGIEQDTSEWSITKWLDRNGRDVIKFLNGMNPLHMKYINDTEALSAVDNMGNLTTDAKSALKDILFESIFKDAGEGVRDIFYSDAFPAKAQRALLATMYRDFQSPEGERIIGDVIDAIRAYGKLMQLKEWQQASNLEEARLIVDEWRRQINYDNTTGEPVIPSAGFSKFATELAARFKGTTQKNLQAVLDGILDLVQGNIEDDLFGEKDKTPRTLAEAVKEILNTDYDGKRRGNVVGSDVSSSAEGGQRESEGDSDREPAPEGAGAPIAAAGVTGLVRAAGEYKGATIEVSPYTNKKKETKDFLLVKFPDELSEAERKSLSALARERKGWYDRKRGGYMVRSAEDAYDIVDALQSIREGATDISESGDKGEVSKGAKGEEKSAEKVGKNEEKGVSSQGEGTDVESSSDEGDLLTVEEIDSSNLDPTIKAIAKSYLEGKRDSFTVTAYELAKQYVRSISRNGAGDSGDAGGAHVGGTVSKSGVVADGRGGESDRRVDGEGVPEAVSGSEQGSGEVSQVGMGEPTGGQGDSGIYGGEPSLFDDSGASVSPRSSGKRGGTRNTGSATREGLSGRGEVSNATPKGGSKATDKRNHGQSLIDSALAELDDIFNNPITLLYSDAGVYAPVPLVSKLGANGMRIMVAATRLGNGLVEVGFHDFDKWRNETNKRLYPLFKNNTELSDEEIDRFITELWDAPFDKDGVVRSAREWAEEEKLESLRKQAHLSIAEKRKLQKERNEQGIEVKLGDIANIRESLPYLFPAQQEDVQKSEVQFFDVTHADREHGNGKGCLFTNGTGTGKTFTGLGIVRRFLNQGKGRILIVTVNDKKIEDWIDDAKNLGISATKLADTKSKGEGVVVTQYANIRQNYELLKDEFDLIVYDESHKIMENQYGEGTTTAAFHYMLSNRDAEQAILRGMQDTPLWQRGRAIEDEIGELRRLLNDYEKQQTYELANKIAQLGGKEAIDRRIKELESEYNSLDKEKEAAVKEALADEKMREAAEKAVARTKVVFLSATPTNTVLNFDYLEGYLFSYPVEEGVERKREDLRSDWVMNNFGSSHKRNKKGVVERLSESKITDPDAASEEEIAFSTYLQDELNTMSGRVLDSPFDYSREFPEVEFAERDIFNNAIAALNNGKYAALNKYFKELFNYNTQTALFEIIKTGPAIERAKEHLAYGRKVVIYHRRLDSKADVASPFRSGIDAAKNDKSEGISELAKKFEKEFAPLLQWEASLDFSFPQDRVMRAFATDEEIAKYESERSAWALGLKGKEPRLKSARVGAINGKETPSARSRVIDEFNRDDSGLDVLIVQVDAGKEGLSLHDTTGKHQRVSISLALPQSPIEFIQLEGRIYRIGNESDAIFEYPLLGVNEELSAFAKKINGRSQTTENLALGNNSRGLRDSIARAALASRIISVQAVMGKGGKTLDDRSLQAATDYDTAISNYGEWANGSVNDGIPFGRRDVPDPIGYKLAEWGASENGETVFIPDAGNGTVARYVSGKSRLWATEVTDARYSRLVTLVGGGGRKIENISLAAISHTSDSHADVCITRVEQLGEVLSIVESSGRVVVLAKESEIGKCNEAMAEHDKGYWHSNKSAEIILPSCAMDSDGEKVHVLVYDLKYDKDAKFATSSAQTTDLSDIEDKDRLFETLRRVQVPARDIDKQERVQKRVSKYIPKLKNIPFLSKSKGYNTSKMRPDIYNNKSRLLISFERGTLYPPIVNEKSGEIENSWRAFEIYYNPIAENNADYIMGLAKTWVMYYEYAKGDRPIEEIIRYKVDEEGKAAARDACIIFRDIISAALGKNEMQIRNIANGITENRVSGTMTIDQFKQVFDGLNAENAEQKDLAERVFLTASKLEGLEIKVVRQAEMPNPNVLGLYTVRKGQSALWISEEKFNSIRFSDETKSSAITHELIHAVTVYFLESYRKGDTSWMSEAQKAACREIFDSYKAINTDEFRAQLRLNSKAEDNAEYGLTSEDEMIAEMSNPVFRSALKQKKVWNQLINGTKKILGIDVTGEEDSETKVYDVLNKALDTLMNSYDNDAYKNFVGQYAMSRPLEIRIGSGVSASGAELKEDRRNALARANERYNADLDAFAKGEGVEPIRFGRPSSVLRACGLNGREMYIRRKTLRDHLEKHGLTVEDIRDLPNALENPLLVYEWGEEAKSLIAITEVEHGKNNRVAIAVELVRKGKRVEVNRIASVQSNNARRLISTIGKKSEEELANDVIRWVGDKEKALKWLGVALSPSEGVSPPRTKGLRVANVIENFENPKLPEENNYREEVSREDKERVVEDLSGELHLGNVRVVDDVESLPEGQRKKKGLYNTRTGEITIILPNNRSLSDVERTVLHEGVVHYGLRDMFGERFDSFLDDVYSGVDSGERAKIVDKARANGWDFRRATEEYLGDVSDGMDWEKSPSLWAKIKYLFHKMLERCGFKNLIRLADNDLRYILWKSRERLKGRGGILESAKDIEKQRELKVGDFSDDELLYRDDDEPTIAEERREVRADYEQRIKKGFYQVREAMLDHMASVKDAMEMIGKGKFKRVEDVPDALNPYLGENRLSSVNEYEMNAMDSVLFRPLERAVAQLAKRRSERDTLIDYMMSKHGLERNEFMAQRDAEAKYADYKAKHPKGKYTLEDFVERQRARDYSGLTNIFGVEDVAEAEEMARDLVDSYEMANDVSELWKRVNDVNKAILDKSLDTGLISQETYDYIRSMYEYYIPLRGFDESTSADEYAYLPDRHNVYNRVVKKAEGRRSKADDPFAYMKSMAATAIVEGNRNQLVKQRFYNFANKYPSDLVSISPVWIRLDEESGRWEVVFPSEISEGDSPAEVAEKMRAFNERMEELSEEEPERYKRAREAGRIPYRVLTSDERRQHQIIVKVDGRDIMMTVNGNPRLALAINGKTNPDNAATGSLGAVLNMIGEANRGLSAIYTTLQPDFITSNYMRDMLYSNTMTLVKESPLYAVRFTANCARFNPITMFVLLDKMRRGALDTSSKVQRQFKEFMENGGETGYMRMMDLESIKKKIEKRMGSIVANDFVRVIGELGRGTEMAARFAAFVTSRDRGRDVARSIWDAKEVSVNFNKKGAGDKFLNKKGQTVVGNAASFVSGFGRAFYIFWNARMQGIFNNFFKYGGRHIGKFAFLLGGMFVYGLLKGMYGGDDERDEEGEYKANYYDVPSYTRMTNIVMKGKGNTWYKYALPHEYRSSYGLGEMIGCKLAGKGELDASTVADLFSEFLPIDIMSGQREGEFNALVPLVPSAATGWYQAERNVSYAGTPIYKDTPYNKDMPGWTKAYSFTNKDLVNLHAAINEWTGGDNEIGEKGWADFNPAYWEYWMRSYIPFYTLANQFSNLYHDFIAGDKEFNWRDVPLANRAVMSGDESMHYRRVNNRYYELKDEYEATKKKLKKYGVQLDKLDKELDEDSGYDGDLWKYLEKVDFLKNSDAYKRYKIFDEYRGDIDKYDKLVKESVEPEEEAYWKDSLNIVKQMLVDDIDMINKKR